MLTKRKFLLAALVEAAILSGCACGKANLQQQEKPAQAQLKAEVVQTPPVAMDTVQAKKVLMEAKGNQFCEGWMKLKTGMSVGDLTQLFGSELGLSYCNQPSACQWSPRLSYYGFPEIKADVTFKFNGGKLTEWTPKDLPPKE